MCKHVAATLYGVGARLDQKPELLFALRGVDHQELIGAAPAVSVRRNAVPEEGERVLAADSLSEIFGIEMESAVPAPKATAKKSKQRAVSQSAATTPSEATPELKEKVIAGEGRKASPGAALDVTRKTKPRRAAKKVPMISAKERRRRAEMMQQFWQKWRRKKALQQKRARTAAPAKKTKQRSSGNPKSPTKESQRS
jgi:uncharacterized Zn finger protein